MGLVRVMVDLEEGLKPTYSDPADGIWDHFASWYPDVFIDISENRGKR